MENLLVQLFWVVLLRSSISEFIGERPLLTNSIPEPAQHVDINENPVMIYPHKDFFPGMRRYSPKKKHLKARRLRRLMGDSFNNSWMSVKNPKNDDVLTQKQLIDVKILEEYRRLNLTMWDSAGNHFVPNGTFLVMFENWLFDHASCPINFIWEDIGILFWPRFVKRGFCEAKYSCSWPSGMHCVAAESKIISLLRWHCRTPITGNGRWNKMGGGKRNNSKKQKKFRSLKCNWVKVPYPVVDTCFCSC